MNDRRSFFRKLIGGSAAVATTTALAKPEPVVEVPELTKVTQINGKDWLIHWTGWKEEPGSEMLLAQWTAKYFFDRKGVGLRIFHGAYASANGHIDSYHLGDMFNNCWMDDYHPISATQSDSAKNARKELMFAKLIEFIQNNPLADHSKCWMCGGCERTEDPRYVPLGRPQQIDEQTWNGLSPGMKNMLRGK